jgi:hypothetical protein
LLGRLSTVIAKEHELYRLVYCRPFVGRLDEVALYNHPLSIEEVRRHLQMGTQQIRDPHRPGTRTAADEGAVRHTATSLD